MTTLLCADIGNSHTTLGVIDDGVVLDHWRVSTDERRTADEWAVLVRGLLRESVVGHQVGGVALCSTVPSVLHEWREMLVRHFDAMHNVVVEAGVRTGVPVLMDNPREVGADRVVNALAAATLYAGPAIVVDFGTATTFDVVSPRGEYIGGAIAPASTSPSRRSAAAAPSCARSSSSAAHRDREEHRRGAPVGLVFGFASQVDGIVERIIGELRRPQSPVDDVQVIATGGLAPVVVDECRSITPTSPG